MLDDNRKKTDQILKLQRDLTTQLQDLRDEKEIEKRAAREDEASNSKTISRLRSALWHHSWY